MTDDDALSRLHYELIRGLIQHNACPANSALAETLGMDQAGVEDLLRSLAAIHGVVLHPHVCAPWVVHPFSCTPTLNWVKGEAGSWWAPCVWCAFGVAALVGGNTQIHTRYGGEDERLVINVGTGQPVSRDIWVHFAIPPARAWDNVHQHCSLVLPFHSPADIREWCDRYSVMMGEVVPLHYVANLAQAWYGSHAGPEWRKWSIAEAEEIFSRVGLTSEFWRLGQRSGHF